MRNRQILVRPRTGRVLAGVCTGIADHFGLSTALIRILFIIAFLMGSLGFWGYIICWIVIPNEKLRSNRY